LGWGKKAFPHKRGRWEKHGSAQLLVEREKRRIIRGVVEKKFCFERVG